MNYRHEGLLSSAKEAANRLFRDTAVTIDITRESLRDLREEIDILISAADATCKDQQNLLDFR